MAEPKYPKGERVWVGYYNAEHELCFILTSNGRIDVNMIANSLLHILGDNAVGEVEIVCNLG